MSRPNGKQTHTRLGTKRSFLSSKRKAGGAERLVFLSQASLRSHCQRLPTQPLLRWCDIMLMSTTHRNVVDAEYGYCLSCAGYPMDLLTSKGSGQCCWMLLSSNMSKPMLSCRHCGFRIDQESYDAYSDMVALYSSASTHEHATSVSKATDESTASDITMASLPVIPEEADAETSSSLSLSSFTSSSLSSTDFLEMEPPNPNDKGGDSPCRLCSGPAVNRHQWRFCPTCGLYIEQQLVET